MTGVLVRQPTPCSVSGPVRRYLVIVVKVPDRNPPQEHTALDGPAADLVNGNLQVRRRVL
jgi:hypothetical protein